jgi:ssDNA-binding Zn-finger/Zn-ribbon topoisomerase 1
VKNNPLPVGFSKADSFIRERDDEISKTGILKSFKLVSGIRTAESIRKIADFLVSQHTPITYDYEKKYKIGKEKSETKNKNEAVNTEDDETKASLINASKAEDINTTIENPQAPKAIIKEGDPCPRCKKGKLVIREVKSKKYKEKYQHEKFLGCENYPKCRYASSIC